MSDTNLPFAPPPWKAIGSLIRGTLRQVFRRHHGNALEAAFDQEPDVVTSAPWAYSRVFAYLLGAFIVLAIVYEISGNPIVIPAALFFGAAAWPTAAALFFLECNTPRNVSLYQFVLLFVSGGLISLLVSVVLFASDPAGIRQFGGLAAPFIEEPAKLALVVLLTRHVTAGWVINGAVFGAAVGAGFAVFETAGYLFYAYVSTGDFAALSDLAGNRGLVAFGSHLAWTAILAGALWTVRAGEPFAWHQLKSRAFLVPLAVVLMLHLVWNSSLGQSSALFLIALALIAAVMALSYLIAGQRQFEAERQAH